MSRSTLRLQPVDPRAEDRADLGNLDNQPRQVHQPAPLLINGKQFRERLGISATKFWTLKKAGIFDGLRGPIRGLYSVSKIERWINDEPLVEVRRRSFSSHKRSA